MAKLMSIIHIIVVECVFVQCEPTHLVPFYCFTCVTFSVCWSTCRVFVVYFSWRKLFLITFQLFSILLLIMANKLISNNNTISSIWSFFPVLLMMNKVLIVIATKKKIGMGGMHHVCMIFLLQWGLWHLLMLLPCEFSKTKQQ